MGESDDKTLDVWIESGRPFTLRLSRNGKVTTSDDSGWTSISPVGYKSILVVVSGSSTHQSSAADLTISVPPDTHVSAPGGMTAYNIAVEAGLDITNR